jgi:flagellar biosynthesis anti-sigma factor FlgM
MAININGLPSSHLPGANESRQVTPVNNEPTNIQRETGKSSASDTVSLSDAAKQLETMENQISSQPVVDAQRVEDARRAVNSGNYQPQPGQISEKLMQFEAMLGTLQKSA